MEECKHNWKQVDNIYFVCIVPGCNEKWNVERLVNTLQSKVEQQQAALTAAQQTIAEQAGEIERLREWYKVATERGADLANKNIKSMQRAESAEAANARLTAEEESLIAWLDSSVPFNPGLAPKYTNGDIDDFYQHDGYRLMTLTERLASVKRDYTYAVEHECDPSECENVDDELRQENARLTERVGVLEGALLVAAKEMTTCGDGDICPLDKMGVCARKLNATKCPLENLYFQPTVKQVHECWQLRWKSMAAFDEAAAALAVERVSGNTVAALGADVASEKPKCFTKCDCGYGTEHCRAGDAPEWAKKNCDGCHLHYSQAKVRDALAVERGEGENK